MADDPSTDGGGRADPFGRAVRDHHRGERAAPLLARDGPETVEHPVEALYFEPFDADTSPGAWLASALSGPLLDLGAGAGRHALFFQERGETVAVEVSDALIETMRERGVRDARRGDMFDLRGTVERDRFASVVAIGTQVGLAGSMDGLRRFLRDLALVTVEGADAVLDCHDPEHPGTAQLLGVRPEPTPGLGFRVLQFDYDGTLGRPLRFRLFSPGRLREAAAATPWTVRDVRRPGESPCYYRARLVNEGWADGDR